MSFKPFREAFPEWLGAQEIPPRTLSWKAKKQIKTLMGKKPRKICFFCGRKCQGRRTDWCSDGCLESYRIMTNDPQTISNKVLERDHGVCSGCGLDCVDAQYRIRTYTFSEIQQDFLLWRLFPTKYQIKDLNAVSIEKIQNVINMLTSKRLWQIDHINPVFMGGGLCGLDNFQTLCLYCHRSKSLNERRQADS